METNVTTIDLDDDQLALLAELLEQDYRDLKQQIGSTEGFRAKDELKAREATTLALLNKVTGGGFGT